MTDPEEITDLRARLLGLVGADPLMSPDRKSELFRIAKDAIAYAQEQLARRSETDAKLKWAELQMAKGRGWSKLRDMLLAAMGAAVVTVVVTVYGTALLTHGGHP